MSSSPDAVPSDETSEANCRPMAMNGVDDESDNSIAGEFDTLSLSGVTEHDHFTCDVCDGEYRQPRVLNCLHVFCEECLGSLLSEDNIKCPTCNMVTECESVLDLPLDYVIANSLDMRAIEGRTVACTSCKANEKAVARCSDCANFLCPNCVTAHKFMRCFEKHKVMDFDEITGNSGGQIHRPIVCPIHGEDQQMKYFCNSCQQPICNDCMLHDHQPPTHQYERIADIEKREAARMMSLVSEAQSKVVQCEEVSNNLQQSLGELESQRDDAKSLIKETFQSYKAMLEERQEALLSQLEQLHERQELSVMETSHKVEKTVDEIQYTCDFVKRIVGQSNSVELMSLKKVMWHRLKSLVERPLAQNMAMGMEFVTDSERFQRAIGDLFGHFKLRDDSALRNQQPQPPVGRSLAKHPSVISDESNHVTMATFPSPLAPTGYVDMLTPGSMLGSPDSGLAGEQQVMRPILSNASSAFLPTAAASITTTSVSDQFGLRNASVTSFTGSLVGANDLGSQSQQSQSPTISDSGIGMDSTSPSAYPNLSHTDLSMTSLSKLGMMSAQGQPLMNKQPFTNIPFNMPPTIGQAFGGLTTSSSPEQELANSHGSGILSPPPIRAAGIIPHFDNIGMQRPRDASRTLSGSNSGFTSPTPSTHHGGPPFPVRGKMTAMQIRSKFGQLGPSKGQFNSPHGFCMGIDEDIVVADTNNHRIQVFDKSGEFKYQFGVPGREEGQLWYPRKVAIIRSTGKYVICDRGNERSRMQIFSKTGHFNKKIAIRYIDIVAGLAITPQNNIVAVDSVSPTVFTISEAGELIKWFDCSDYMREPSDIAVKDKEYFVCDFKGHCVVVFNEDGQFQRRIGTDSITNFPNGIDISDCGDILVGDSHGNRFHVAVFQRDGSLIGEFECPYVKVSRCCGLKITSEGYVVTLAKNNHHVLVLNTLYIS